MKKAILYAGAVINFLMVILHARFWTILNWEEELAKLTAENSAVVQVSNIVMIFVLAYFTVMSIVMARMKRLDTAAKSILVLIAVFYFLRLALGYLFFGFNMEELVIWIVCGVITAGYLSVLCIDRKG